MNFFGKHILPELQTRRIEGKSRVVVQIPEKTTKTYCLCRSSDEGEMVVCDSCDNWYHPSCVNLKRLPVKKIRYCPQCRKRKIKENDT